MMCRVTHVVTIRCVRVTPEHSDPITWNIYICNDVFQDEYNDSKGSNNKTKTVFNIISICQHWWKDLVRVGVKPVTTYTPIQQAKSQ